MNKYVLKATIYPERVNFKLSGLSSRYKNLFISSPELGIDGTFNIEIENSKGTITFKSEKNYNFDTNPNIETLKNFVEKVSRLFVDTYCFIHSYNYDLIIDSVECKEIDLKHTFSVKGEFGFTGDNRNFVKYLDVILLKQSSSFSDVFADYRRSIKYPDMTAAHCLRAIETIRRTHFDNPEIEDDNERDIDGWKKMSKEIGVKPNFSYKLMQKFATPNRHGIYPIITWEQRKEIMGFTREVIKESLEWLAKS